MLAFDTVAHAYTWDGHPVPGVTTILLPLMDFSRIDPEVLAAKAALGTAVHVATELSDADDLVEDSVHDSVRPYLDAWRKFRSDTGAEILSAEQQVFHPLHRYAGTLDRVLKLDGLKYLTDIKSSAEIPASAGPQTAAYLSALGDASVIRRAVVQLKPDGAYRFHKLEDPNDMAVFISCLTIYRHREKFQ